MNKLLGKTLLGHSSAGTVTEVGLPFFEQLRLQTLPCLSVTELGMRSSCLGMIRSCLGMTFPDSVIAQSLEKKDLAVASCNHPTGSGSI